MPQDRPSREAFISFARRVEPRLRYALVAGCGPERGIEATAEALAYAWEHWDRISQLKNPAGYLYRIAQRRAWRNHGVTEVPLMGPTPVADPPPVEPGLEPALSHLSKKQRTAVVLIEGFSWTYQEVADLQGVARSTVQKHHDRGMAALRSEMGVSIDV